MSRLDITNSPGVSFEPGRVSSRIDLRAGPSGDGIARKPMRIASVDIIRGLAVVLMAIDHVRVYAGVPAGGPDPEVFFTRWVTHFVAPIFVFLAGTSAYLYGRRLSHPSELSSWLIKRGLLLVVLELTVMRLAWTFNGDFGATALGGVIWMLGWCMVLMGGLVHLPLRTIATVGILVVACHNLLDFVPRETVREWTTGTLGWLWQILYFGGSFRIGEHGPNVFILFSIVPWIGVMACGYVFAKVFEWPEARRRRFCFGLGAIMVAAFVLLRAWDGYGDQSRWRQISPVAGNTIAAVPPLPSYHPALAFLATSKYPASLLFLLMTVGPAILLLGIAPRLPSRATAVLDTFGRVPLFYYVLHIPLIHTLACIVSLVRWGRVDPWLLLNHPAMVPPAPPGYRWSLWLLYGATAVAVAILYFCCRSYANYKSRHRYRWLSYL